MSARNTPQHNDDSRLMSTFESSQLPNYLSTTKSSINKKVEKRKSSTFLSHRQSVFVGSGDNSLVDSSFSSPKKLD